MSPGWLTDALRESGVLGDGTVACWGLQPTFELTDVGRVNIALRGQALLGEIRAAPRRYCRRTRPNARLTLGRGLATTRTLWPCDRHHATGQDRRAPAPS